MTQNFLVGGTFQTGAYHVVKGKDVLEPYMIQVLLMAYLVRRRCEKSMMDFWCHEELLAERIKRLLMQG